MSDQLAAGVAARLSRYLQVATQARRMGKRRLSSKEIGAYAAINATQVRRDLSAFGRFGKRGVGYQLDLLLAELRTILGLGGPYKIALVGGDGLGAALANSTLLREHGFEIAAVFEPNNDRVGKALGATVVRDYGEMQKVVRAQGMIAAVLTGPAEAAQRASDDLAAAGVQLIFNYTEALLEAPQGVLVHTYNPAGELLTGLHAYLARQPSQREA